MRDAAKDIFDSLNTETELQAFIQGQVENLYVDFKSKQILTTFDVDADLQKVLSKAICGFANSDGGVIILGIDAPQGQMPTFKVIQPYVMFEQEVNSYISRSTSFVVQGVLIKNIQTPAHNGGVVLVYVPKSDQAPHCSMKDKRYYQRIGDSFHPMEHYQVADMFGKRHFPHILPFGLLKGDINTRGKIEFTFGLKNEGRAIGQYPYLKFNTLNGFTFNRFGISGNGHFGLNPFPNPTNFNEYRGGVDHVIHPGTDLMVTRMELNCGVDQQGLLIHPTADILIEGVLAADNFSARKWRITLSVQAIQNAITN